MKLIRRLADMVRRAWWRSAGNRSSARAEDPVAPPRAPGLDCPQCSARLTVTIQMLLASTPVRCHECALVLHVDRQASKECLERLAELQTAIDRANAVARSHGS